MAARKKQKSGATAEKAAKPLSGQKAKKAKLQNAGPELEERRAVEDQELGRELGQAGQSYELENGSHPYGVKPMGNMYVEKALVNVRDVGLGDLYKLSDEQVLDILGRLDARDLCKAAQVGKAFYVFAHHDELWRALTLQEFTSGFTYAREGWKQTYLNHRLAATFPTPASANPNSDPKATPIPPQDPQPSSTRAKRSKQLDGSKQQLQPSTNRSLPKHVPLSVLGFYSDYLFQSWLCASISVKEEWLARSTVPRRSNLTLQQFIDEFERPNRPVIITDVVEKWPAFRKWDREYLLAAAGKEKFACGPVEFTMAEYHAYGDWAIEERPLYLFDSKFGEKVPQLAEDYEVPEYFQEDLFGLLGNKRPDFRWLIVGPARSGSSWHIDPNATSAWNAVIRGSKKWILYPPSTNPPGVRPSPDGADVVAPVSIAEWFMNFYDDTRQGDAMRPLECICRAGEVLFVPRGWWHTVVNLEESVAVTQNYVSRRNILEALSFLGRPNAKDLVSGTRDRESLHGAFKAAFMEKFPGELERLEKEAAAERARKERQKSFWESVTDGGAPAFTLGLISPGVKSTEEPVKANASQRGFRFKFGSSS